MTDRLWSRPFLLLWAFTFLTFFAAFQLFPTGPLRLVQLGATKAESGRFLTAFTVGSALGAFATGQIADRIGLRRMMGLTAALFTLIMAAYAFIHVRWMLFALAPVHGAVWSGLVTSQPAMLGAIIPEGRRAEGMSWYGLASPGGVIFGPTFGILVFRLAGWKTMCLLLVPCFAILAWLSRQLPPDPPRHVRSKHPLRLPEREVFTLSAILFFIALSYGTLTSYSAQEALGEGFAWPAAFLSCLAIGMVGMRAFMGLRGFGRRPIRLLPAMALVTAAGLAILAFAPGGTARHIAGGLVYGAGYSMIYTLLNAEVLEVVAPDRRGAAFGAFMSAFDTGIGLGSFAFGLIIGRMGFRWGWGAGLAAALIAVPVGMRLAQRRRQAPSL
ncbi:MAG TPA: MFS transporter [Holophagaceae bacterium]|jgi:MFS family permease|nr:MFS transporter [Holophagaceae bacterium]